MTAAEVAASTGTQAFALGEEQRQIQQMVQMLLGLKSKPSPDDAADALAVAVCHAHSAGLRAILQDKGAG